MAESRILSDGDMFNAGASCPACHEQRAHTSEELGRHHPFSGHGCVDGNWSHPELAREYAEKQAAEKQAAAAALGKPK